MKETADAACVATKQATRQYSDRIMNSDASLSMNVKKRWFYTHMKKQFVSSRNSCETAL
jgi:hypothetical protein